MKMRSLSVVGLYFLLMVGFSGQVGAFSEEDLKKLKATGNCVKCDLSGADLTGANLTGAKLEGANLAFYGCSGCNLEKADLTGANLTAANLAGVDLADAIFCKTTMSDGVVDNATC